VYYKLNYNKMQKKEARRVGWLVGRPVAFWPCWGKTVRGHGVYRINTLAKLRSSFYTFPARWHRARRWTFPHKMPLDLQCPKTKKPNGDVL
jgi:hypothetical protein